MKFKHRQVMKAIKRCNCLGSGSVRDVFELDDQLVVKVSENGYACPQTLAELHAYQTLPQASTYCTWVGTTKRLLKKGIIVAERVESLESYLASIGVDVTYLDDYDLMYESGQEELLNEVDLTHSYAAAMIQDFFIWANANGVYDLAMPNLGVRTSTNQVVLLDLGFGSESTGGLMYTGERA